MTKRKIQKKIGVGVDVVKPGAFVNCTNLNRIDFAGGQPWIWWGTFDGVSDTAIVGYKGREINVKDLKEVLSDPEGYPSKLSDELLDEALAKQAEKEKKPEKKKHAYRGR